MADILPYRKHFHRDWRNSATVQMMPWAARAIYLELLDWQWESERLPNAQANAIRLLRISLEEWEIFAPFFDQCFPVCDDGNRRNARLDDERRQVVERIAKARESGSKGGSVGGKKKVKKEASKRTLSERQSEPPSERQTKQIQSKNTNVFSVPTQDQCVFYGASIALSREESEKFFDYQESSGWKVGTKPMKDWQAAMRTWKRGVGKFDKASGDSWGDPC